MAFWRRSLASMRRGIAHAVAAMAALSALAILAMSVGCGTMMWQTDIYHTGRVLDEGQKLASGSAYLLFPATAGFSYGISDGWELSGRAGYCGTYDPWQGPRDQDIPLAQFRLTEVGLGVHRSLLRSEPFYAAASADLAGFVTDFNLKSPAVYGAKLTVGATPSIYPLDGFGIYVPLQLTLLTANDGNRQATFYPGLGLAVDQGWFSFRLAGTIPAWTQAKDVGGNRRLIPIGSLGILCGVRW